MPEAQISELPLTCGDRERTHFRRKLRAFLTHVQANHAAPSSIQNLQSKLSEKAQSDQRHGFTEFRLGSAHSVNRYRA